MARARTAGAQSRTDPVWGGLEPGSKVLVDTAPFIYLLESHPVLADAYAGLFEAAADGKISIALSTVTLAEVLTGPCKAGLAALARRYERTLCGYEVVPITVPVATLAARLRAQNRLKLPDAMQLACAIETGATAFVTHDRGFSGVDALPIVTAG